jgi:hypothetical protein
MFPVVHLLLNIFRNPAESQVKRLLKESKLPSSDLSARHLEHFGVVVQLRRRRELSVLRSTAMWRFFGHSRLQSIPAAKAMGGHSSPRPSGRRGEIV